ncbi:MAG: hypothetical protein GW763_05675 [Paraglaciecola sp.]|nr:hypothetical protein [Paraglaciecola sp.]NCT47471.1 hypothetical protein [Paraglaciecola sp.]
MKYKMPLLAAMTMMLSACELLPKNMQGLLKKEGAEPAVVDAQFCISSTTEVAVEQNCNMNYWLDYWSAIENSTWSQRKAKIDALGDDIDAVLRKILLSQGKGTPYNSRLRAQSWIEGLLPKVTPQMRNFLSVAIYQPSQELLEMESALVTVGKLNSSLSAINEQQKQMLDKQKNQIEALLKIEATIMDNGNGDK